jgi:hypothetical protein
MFAWKLVHGTAEPTFENRPLALAEPSTCHLATVVAPFQLA